LTSRCRWASLAGIETVLWMRAMNRMAVAGAVMLALAGLGFWRPAVAQTASAAAPAAESAAPKHIPARPPTRIRVHPLAQTYPGPDAVRQCTAWLAPEYRPSGTVIVPKMRCWWERG
jgi:hypothetical protein